ncbi:MAG: GNAT family N-acetyltransferase [Nitrospina sp.]|jgi:GNAT superfamily N-acetyltransferase|nr:GNAT family N-acetyltransferase [Nitrospina sp.]
MNSLKDMRIAHLIEHPFVIPVLTQWFMDEWTPWYGPGGSGNAKQDLEECSRRDALPICLIALSENGTVLGTGTLKSKSTGSKRSDGPWMSALLVSKNYRGKGIGTALIEAIEKEAQRLGFSSVYCSTNTAENTLQRRGWEADGTAETLRGPVPVYRLKLT